MKNNKTDRNSIYDPMNAMDVDRLTKIIIFRELDLFDEKELVPIEQYDEGSLLEKFPSLENTWCLVRNDRLICVIGLFLIEDNLEEYPEMVVDIFSGPRLKDTDNPDTALVWDKSMEFRAAGGCTLQA